MSSGGYDASYSYSTYVPGDSWHAPDSIYHRPHHLPSHRRSPSPPRRYMTYDRYVPSRSPPRSGPTWSDSYRPDSPSPISGRYHADTPNPYRARSPSPWTTLRLTPKPYLARSQSPEYFSSYVPDVDPWDSSSAWQQPLETSIVQQRQPSSPTPSASRDKGRRGSILAKRMFEPSDSWKQSHSDRREATARGPDEISPTTHGAAYRPVPHNDRSVVGRTGYDHYIPGYPSSTPDNRRKSSPRPRVRNIWPATRSRSRSVSLPPREPRRASPYPRRRRSRGRSPSRGPRSLSRHRTYSRGIRSSRDGRRSLSRSRRSITRRHRSNSRRYSYSRSSSRGRSVSRTRSLRNGITISKHFNGGSGKKSRTRSPSRSSIASSIASSRASDRMPPPPVEKAHPPIAPEVNVLDDTHQTTQVNTDAKPVQSPPSSPKVASLPNGLDSDAKQTESIQVLLPSGTLDQPKKKLEPESVTVTDAPVPPPPLPLPRSPVAVQHTRPSDSEKAPHLNGAVEPELTLKTVGMLGTGPTTSNTTPTNTSLLLSPVPSSPSASNQIANLPGSDHQGFTLTPKPSTIPTARLSNSQPKLVPQIRQEITPPKPENIPKLSNAKSTTEALRTVVMTRLLHDRQTREDRVNPVLMTNLQLAAHSRDPRPSTTVENIIEEATEGRRRADRIEHISSLRGSLVEHFQHRQTVISEKIQRLRKEYVSLHERWLAHCASLDDQARPAVIAEFENVQPVTRATRRSTNMSDAVRSDLEMEQIIASLGYDEATDPNQLSLRNLATVPDMISVTNGKVDYVFDDTDHLVDNPSEYYGPSTGIHDWTEAEKEIFLDKFAAYPKQFGVIAEHIPNKTAAQCVDYYYLHKKKVIDFRKVISQFAPGKRKRKGTGRKKGNGLLADIRQHDAEVHRESEPPPPAAASGRTGRRRMARPPPKEPKKPTVSRRTTILQLEETSTATPTPEPETRPRRRRGTGIASAAASSNATPITTPAPFITPATPAPIMNSLPTHLTLAASLSRTISIAAEDAEEEPLDNERPAKKSRRPRKVKSAAIVTEEPPDPVQETKPADQAESNTRRKATPISIQWSDEDKSLFLKLLGQYGDDFKRIAASMPNKTTVQVSNYYKSNLVDLELEKVAAGAPKRSPTPEARESSKDSPQPGTVPDSAPPMSSLTHDTSRASSRRTSRDVPISSTIRSNLSGVSKQPELASATTSPYAYLASHATNGRLGYTSSTIPPAPYPTIPYTYSYTDSHYAHYTRTGQRPIAPHPDPTRRGAAVPSIHKGENPYPVLPPPGVPPPSTPYHYSLES